jgi:O-antigen ligase
MLNRAREVTAGPGPVLIVLVLLLALGGGVVVSQSSLELSLAGTLLLIVLFASFLNTELALHIILLSMLLSPEIVVGGLGGISLGKPSVKGDLLVLRAEDLILVAVAFAWLARTALFKELGFIRKTPLNPAIFAYTASLILATLWGIFAEFVPPLRGFFFTLKYIEFFVVYFMTANLVQEERQAFRLLTTAFVTCAIAAIIGISQIPSGERVAAPFEGQYGEPNTFGGYLVLMLALILAYALSARPAISRLRWAGFAVLIVVPLLYTLSRSSWLAAIPMLLTLIVLSPRRLTLMIALGVLLIVGVSIMPKQVVDRYNYTWNATYDRGEYRIGNAKLDTSTSARLESWSTGFYAWTRQPFLGYGVTGFGFIDAQFVRVLIETGLIGLAAFVWLLWCILRMAWSTYRQTIGTRLEGLSLGYLAGILAMVTHSIGANTFIIVRIMEPFWFMTGIIAMLPTLVSAADQKMGDYKTTDYKAAHTRSVRNSL